MDEGEGLEVWALQIREAVLRIREILIGLVFHPISRFLVRSISRCLLLYEVVIGTPIIILIDVMQSIIRAPRLSEEQTLSFGYILLLIDHEFVAPTRAALLGLWAHNLRLRKCLHYHLIKVDNAAVMVPTILLHNYGCGG